MSEATVSNQTSREVVDLLVARGISASRIAGLLRVSRSYISRVKAGTRSLTLDHLATLEAELRIPVPLLLMEAIPRARVSPKLRPLYDATVKLLHDTALGVSRTTSRRKPRSTGSKRVRRARAA